MTKKLYFLFFLILSSFYINAQQTVGLFTYTAEAREGYTLFAPMSSNNTFLIDNCGEKVHSWPSVYNPGVSTYLLENGILLRAGNVTNPTFTSAGGEGGIIEMIDWNGNVIWDYTLSSATQCMHHDITYLPNGNILAIVWDLYTSQQVLDAGGTYGGNSLWSEKIIEIQPDLVNGGGTIIWEWNVWDHLIQDENPTKPNYGVVGNNPRRIDLNYPHGAVSGDWLHINGIDYNEDLDQIMLSIYTFNEIWVIDHSTTTLEAAGSTGGNSGLGGDLLFRWGNPEAYNQGTVANKKLFRQHHPHWIENGLIDEGKIMVFNNKVGTVPNQEYSTVNIIEPIFNASGGYEIQNDTFLPTEFYWTFKEENPSDFYSGFVSGAQRLENGNTLICEGAFGRFFEINPMEEIVWEYINPVGPTITNQGDAPTQNVVFRATKHPSGFAAFIGKDLTPQGYIETGSTFSCDILLSNNEVPYNNDFIVFPNPASSYFNIKSTVKVEKLSVYDISGKRVKEFIINGTEAKINCSNLYKGLYILKTHLINGIVKNTKLIID
ncbi:aryl-sulfate sulfotransferase [Wocania ichthyoenteri]|uniref:aryl-sulfate sulfotransferase n=1 Tax=Wocania ichthyoenteri TaxID=1230531 RepID=UPI00053DA8EC|nr:aryl-sulfate sulfotransferase [Wocania ichthyoenteri]